jgi:hypothetical protein
MTMTNTTTSGGAGGWHVGRAAAQCAACGTDLPPKTECWAALCDAPLEQLSTAEKAEKEKADARAKKEKTRETPAASPFARVDFCEACWAAGKRPAPPLAMFSFWKTVVPSPEQKKKLLVDDSVLVDVFTRMEGKTEPSEIRFRFVLALILMRKRLLKYEGTQEKPEGMEKGPEIWRMIPRGTDQAVHVVNPHLTEEQIAEVSQQLSAILAEEL